jgi:hypothetical protein
MRSLFTGVLPLLTVSGPTSGISHRSEHHAHEFAGHDAPCDRRAHCSRQPHCRYRRRLGKEASDVLYHLCSADNPQGSSGRQGALKPAQPDQNAQNQTDHPPPLPRVPCQDHSTTRAARVLQHGQLYCTTNIVTHVHALREDVPLDWRMLLSGHLPKLVYVRGRLDQSLPFEALRRRSLINDRARAATDAPDFSRRIRAVNAD